MQRIVRVIVAALLAAETAAVTAQTPAPRAPDKLPVLAKINCGTHWTGWVEQLDGVNPCPAGCEPGERQLVNTDKQADKTLYSARFQCYVTPKLANRPPPAAVAEKLAGMQKTCPDMVRGLAEVGTLKEGIYQIPQGWFFRAEAKNAQNGEAYLECYYGRQARESLRAASHAYEVAYPLTGYRAEQCSVQGATVTCRR